MMIEVHLRTIDIRPSTSRVVRRKQRDGLCVRSDSTTAYDANRHAAYLFRLLLRKLVWILNARPTLNAHAKLFKNENIMFYELSVNARDTCTRTTIKMHVVFFFINEKLISQGVLGRVSTRLVIRFVRSNTTRSPPARERASFRY